VYGLFRRRQLDGTWAVIVLALQAWRMMPGT